MGPQRYREPVTLDNGICTAVIDPTGAHCLQFSHKRTQIRLFHEDMDPLLSGIPVLFPVNRIDGGKMTCAGVSYSLPVNEERTNCALHGTLYAQPFSVSEQTAARAVFCFDSDGRYFGFPQDFSMEIAYALDRSILHQAVRIINHADTPLPLLIGFHTSFAIPFCPGSCAEDIRVTADLAAELTRDSRCLTVGRTAPDMLFSALCEGTYRPTAPISRQYRAGEYGEILLTDPRTGVCVRYRPDSMFRYRLFYTPECGYLCMEPQTCAVNAPNLPQDSPDAGYPMLAAGETVTLHSTIALEGLE